VNNDQAGILGIGFNSFLVRDRVQAIFSPENPAMKKVKIVADQEQMIINLTFGYETRSIILMDSGHIVLTILSVDEFLEHYDATSQA